MVTQIWNKQMTYVVDQLSPTVQQIANFGFQRFTVPKVSYTQDELQAWWSSAGHFSFFDEFGNPTEKLATWLDMTGMAYSGYMSFLKVDGHGSAASNDFQYWYLLNRNCNFVDYNLSLSNTRVVAYDATNSSYGINERYNTSVSGWGQNWWGNGVTRAETNGGSYIPFGWDFTYSTHTGYGYWIVTSDNYVWGIKLYYNEHNSTIVKYGATNSAKIIQILDSMPDYVPPDPYEPGGYSGSGGGSGDFNFASDHIGDSPLPTLSFADTGFCRIYNPTLVQLQALANYMWTDATFLQTVINHAKQLLENPIDAIISLSMVPVPVQQGTSEVVKVLFISTGVSMAPIINQFVDVDCGTLSIPLAYGSSLDYNPYTKIDLYLPYIGQVSIDTDEVMGRTLHCVYRVDVVTGMCVAKIFANGYYSSDTEEPLYQFAGHCGIQMPLTSADFSGYVGAVISATKMVAGLAAAGAGNPGVAAGLIGGPSPHKSSATHHEKINTSGSQERSQKSGRLISAPTQNWEHSETRDYESKGASFGELASASVANTVGAIMTSKMNFEHSGGFTGTSGYLGVRRPFAIIKHPNQCYPKGYANWNGFPAMITMNLGDCSGYTRVQSVHLTGFSATNPELSEISELLKTGVIF